MLYTDKIVAYEIQCLACLTINRREISIINNNRRLRIAKNNFKGLLIKRK